MADILTDAELAAIRERAAEATEGPWTLGSVEWIPDRFDGHMAYPVEPAIAGDAFEEDAEFIAHARTDVPALLAYVDHLRAENESLRDDAALSLRIPMVPFTGQEPHGGNRGAEV